MAQIRMSIWDDPKFKEPSQVPGDWIVVRHALFEHSDAPLAVKYAIEKLTVQLLRRDLVEDESVTHALSYSGTSGAGGHPSTVRLELKAAAPDRLLYLLTSERTAPKRWEDEDKFTQDCERRFARWCSQLKLVPSMAEWPGASAALLALTVRLAIADEEAAALIVDDPYPVAAVQRDVIDALRAGMVFFTASKEGGSHLFFDGKVFRRNDYGEEPLRNETYADDAAMLEALRRLYAWDAQSNTYPHPKPEIEIWNYIRGKLTSRR